MGDPHNVAAITPSERNLANPKSAIFKVMSDGGQEDAVNEDEFDLTELLPETSPSSSLGLL